MIDRMPNSLPHQQARPQPGSTRLPPIAVAATTLIITVITVSLLVTSPNLGLRANITDSAVTPAVPSVDILLMGALTQQLHLYPDELSEARLTATGLRFQSRGAPLEVRLEATGPAGATDLDLAEHPLRLALIDDAGIPYRVFVSTSGRLERTSDGARFTATLEDSTGEMLIASGRLRGDSHTGKEAAKP